MPSAAKYEPKRLHFQKSLIGISRIKTLAIHHDKLYVGYVNKMKEICGETRSYERRWCRP